MPQKIIEISGPYFEDFTLNQTLEPAPAITVTSGHTAIYQSFFADRLRLPLDFELCKIILGSSKQLIHTQLLFNIAVGQTTYATQLVKGNLFYRGVIFKKPVFEGDTLSTATKVVALRQNKIKEGRSATGLVVLEISVKNQHGEEVLQFWRCPMVPCRDTNADTGKKDVFDAIPETIDIEAIKEMIPPEWDLKLFKENFSGIHFKQLEEGSIFKVISRDTITSAPELVRMTLNMAMTHLDAGVSAYKKRLVYGGHTISMAAAQLSRAVPNIVNILAWKHCDHTAPVFENDVIRTEIEVVKKYPLESKGGLVEFHLQVYANREEEANDPSLEVKVLDWNLIVLMA